MKIKKIENKSQGKLKNITYILIIAIITILFFTGYSIRKRYKSNNCKRKYTNSRTSYRDKIKS